MSTKKEIIYSVLEKLRIHTDDSDISEEMVSHLIDIKRAMLVKQQYSKTFWHMPNGIKQELCLGLSLVPKISGYGCAGKILSTDISLPKAIKIKGKEGPLNVRKEDGTEIALTIVPIERLPFLFENRFTQHLTYCAVDMNGKLLIISKDNKHKFLKSIKVTDIFERPDDVRAWECNYDSSNEDPWEIEYPLESAMEDTVVELVLKDLARTLGIPSDNINDATDEIRR